MATIVQDLRYGVRMLRRSPMFTVVAIVTLALCVGANTAIFTLVNAVLLRPLPYPNSDRMVWVREYLPHIKNELVIGPDYVNWRDRSRSFEKIAAYTNDNFNVSGIGQPVRVEAAQVTSTFFPLFHTQMGLGRPFVANEDVPNAPPTAILTHGFWQNHFGGASDAVGKSLLLNGTSYAIVGVLPQGFRFPDDEIKPDILIPLPLPTYNPADNSFLNVSVVGLLSKDASAQGAIAELDVLSQQLHRAAKPDEFLEGMTTRITPLQEHLVGDTRRSLLVLLVAVGFVLLIGCVNIANLQLVRASGRERELAVRTALGASRLRLTRQLLTENVLLALAGGAAGFFLATWLVNAIRKLQLDMLPSVVEIRADGHVFAFTLLVTIMTGLAFGAAPAILYTRKDPGSRLHSGSRASSGIGQRRLSNVLVIFEMALALVLLVGAGLLVRTLTGLLRSDPGFDAKHLLTAQIVLAENKYPHSSERLRFFDALLPRLLALPGVQGVAAGSSLPLAGHVMHGTVRVEGQAEVPPALAPSLFIDGISPEYFQTMRMTVLKGRTFVAEDSRRDPPSAVILNQSAAAKLFPGQDAVGKRMKMYSETDWAEIVGVVSDVRDNGLDEDNSPQMYMPLRFAPRISKIALRATGDPAELASSLRTAVAAVDSDQPVFDVITMEDRVAESLVARRFNTWLLSGFALLALILAGVGIYGVVSYAVAQRNHEIGIRMALGADRRQVLQLVLRGGTWLALAGIGFGIVGALALGRFIKGLLYGVDAADAITLISVSALLLLTALTASFIPARRASNVDPIVALRNE